MSFKTETLPTAQFTAQHNAHADYEKKCYKHKWSGEQRCYNYQDIFLPEKLNYRGIVPGFQHAVAVGGTRSPSIDAFCLCSKVITALSNSNATILSGGVPGIDMAAHLAAITCQLSTYAVLGNPVSEGLSGHEWNNKIIEDAILSCGGFISEYSTIEPFNNEIFRERLLARDRIISGLSSVFLMFECNRDSATIDTAKRAQLQGKQIICIDTKNKNNRRGIEQAAEELYCPVLQEGEISIETIAEIIINKIGLVRIS